MINFNLQAFMFALIHIRNEIANAQARSNPDALLVGPSQERFKEIFSKWIEPPLRKLDIADGRLRDIAALARGGLYSSLLHELTALNSDILHAAEKEWFYHYRKDKGYLVVRVKRKWEAVIREFKRAEEDICAGVDCYAMEHYTASVFHFVRAAEHGLRAVAKERKVTLPKNKKIEYAQWGDVIDALDKEVERIQRNVSAGAHKDQALAFYTGVVANLRHLKDKYRNVVMHARASFDEGEALSAMTRTHELMDMVSVVLDEHGHKKKRWRL
jgi:hypothetical protein